MVPSTSSAVTPTSLPASIATSAARSYTDGTVPSTSSPVTPTSLPTSIATSAARSYTDGTVPSTSSAVTPTSLPASIATSAARSYTDGTVPSTSSAVTPTKYSIEPQNFSADALRTPLLALPVSLAPALSSPTGPFESLPEPLRRHQCHFCEYFVYKVILGHGQRPKSPTSNMADEMGAGEGSSCRELSRLTCHRTSDLLHFTFSHCQGLIRICGLRQAGPPFSGDFWNISLASRQEQIPQEVYKGLGNGVPRLLQSTAHWPGGGNRVTATERLDCSPPIMANGVAPGFSQLGIVSDDAAGGRLFSGGGSPVSPALTFSRCSINHLISPSSVLKTSLLRAAKIFELNSTGLWYQGSVFDSWLHDANFYDTLEPRTRRDCSISVIRKTNEVGGLNVSSTAKSSKTLQVAQGRGIVEGMGHGHCLGPIPAFAWSDFGKPWKAEVKTAGPRIELGPSRMRLARLPPRRPELATPGFSQVGIVPDDAAGRRVFSGISRSPPCIPVLFHSQFISPSSALKIPLLSASRISLHATQLKREKEQGVQAAGSPPTATSPQFGALSTFLDPLFLLLRPLIAIDCHVVVRSLHEAEEYPGSRTSRASEKAEDTHEGNMADVAVSWRESSGTLPSTPPLHSTAAPYLPHFTLTDALYFDRCLDRTIAPRGSSKLFQEKYRKNHPMR
ncbi:hypothetical protein PR048_030365 [Dryococelus australis]|uniref:Uncharacterized protein n=1 Tax=Dryococelus australis TaxID=614101 RepID=A0ABQ9G8S3_9NEOP|nr:hypothetical protein PR048_030365 [Dryococelus australis]